MSEHIPLATCAKECGVDVAIILQDNDVRDGKKPIGIFIPLEHFCIKYYTTKIKSNDGVKYSNKLIREVWATYEPKMKKRTDFIIQSRSFISNNESSFQKLMPNDIQRILENGHYKTIITAVMPYSHRIGKRICIKKDRVDPLEVSISDLYLTKNDVEALKARYAKTSVLAIQPVNHGAIKNKRKSDNKWAPLLSMAISIIEQKQLMKNSISAIELAGCVISALPRNQKAEVNIGTFRKKLSKDPKIRYFLK